MVKSPFNSFLRTAFGVLAFTAAFNLAAADAVQSPRLNMSALSAGVAAHQAQAAEARQKLRIRAQAHAATSAASAANVVLGGNGFASPSRAYPPSCLADNLPVYQSGADPNAQSIQLTLAGYDENNNAITETDTFTVWRTPCSGNVSATLIEIDRPSSATGFVLFPNIYFPPSSSPYYPRLPNDSNTVFSDTLGGGAMFSGNVYVLEYYDGDVAGVDGVPDFNQAFSLNIDTLVQDSNGNDITGTLSVPAYSAANFNNYPSASNPLEISGYVSGPWYDSAHSGEGMLIEVYDNGDQATRTFAATWYTFDNLGLPFWLVTAANVPIQGTAQGVTNGFQIVNAPVSYITGGGFAGNFTPPVTSNNWGTMSFSFPNCGTMNFTYSGATGANVNNGPTGSGTKQWTRVGNISGVVCQ